MKISATSMLASCVSLFVALFVRLFSLCSIQVSIQTQSSPKLTHMVGTSSRKNWLNFQGHARVKSQFTQRRPLNFKVIRSKIKVDVA